MNISKKFLIYIIVIAIAIAGALAWLLWQGKDSKPDTARNLATCGLSSTDGQALSIRQGTVGRISAINIGVKSVKDGKTYLQFWDSDTELNQPTIALGPCEKVDFKGSWIYVLDVNQGWQNPFGRPGSSGGSVEIFVQTPK